MDIAESVNTRQFKTVWLQYFSFKRSFSLQRVRRMDRKRKALGLETKYEIINEVEKSGKSKIEIAKHNINILVSLNSYLNRYHAL